MNSEALLIFCKYQRNGKESKSAVTSNHPKNRRDFQVIPVFPFTYFAFHRRIINRIKLKKEKIMKFIKRLIPMLLSLVIMISAPFSLAAKNEGLTETSVIPEIAFDYSVKSAYLIEAKTGTVIFAKNEEETADIASVTKIMTLLLVMEALEAGNFKLDDTVSISDYAASMGGSQVFLEEGEKITVEELIKCTVIASANDAAVALAELTCGTESAFVSRMNERAEQLGLKNSVFENTTGLDDTTKDHHSCAYDVALLSRELIKYPLILKYSSVWQYSIRNGEMVLTNTNRLVRYYDGCNGLKTGSTDKAGYCVSAAAKRGNMQLVAVILGADTKDERNTAARALLDYGFANYSLYETDEGYLEDATVLRGVNDSVKLYTSSFSSLIPKGRSASVEKIYDIPENIKAPISKNSVVGSVTYKLGDTELGRSDVFTGEDVEEINLFEVILRILSKIVTGK